MRRAGIDRRPTGLDEFLSGVTRRRRAEMAAGTGLGEFTPLRRTLVQGVALRDVLLALRADTDALCRALRVALSRTPGVSRPPSRG